MFRSGRLSFRSARIPKSTPSSCLARPGLKRGLGSLRSTSSSLWSRSGIGLMIGSLIVFSLSTNGSPALLDSKVQVDRDTNVATIRIVTRSELAQHNTEDCLWVAIDGQVWDVTAFLAIHPGGREILLQHAGQDVTRLFKGIHPSNTLVTSLKASDMVGTLEESGASHPAFAPSGVLGGKVKAIFSLNDLNEIARTLCHDDAWDYYSGYAETGSSYNGNTTAFERVFFRPRVMRNVKEVNASTDVLDYATVAPFFVSPTARNALAQELGEIAITRAAGTSGILQVLSHVASKSLSEVLAERIPGQEIAWQLYMKPDRRKAEEEIRQAVNLGAHSIWLTVDTVVPSNHTDALRRAHQRNPILPAGRDVSLALDPVVTLSSRHDAALTWEDVAWIKSLAEGRKVVVKGIGAWEDAVLARKHGADAVLLSNHGGRALDYSNAPLRTLRDINQNSPELIEDQNFQIFVDGGIRSGTDILKALCLGANAVGIGRPFIYAAAWNGQVGVEIAIRMLRKELESNMRYLGVTSLKELGPHLVDISQL